MDRTNGLYRSEHAISGILLNKGFHRFNPYFAKPCDSHERKLYKALESPRPKLSMYILTISLITALDRKMLFTASYNKTCMHPLHAYHLSALLSTPASHSSWRRILAYFCHHITITLSTLSAPLTYPILRKAKNRRERNISKTRLTPSNTWLEASVKYLYRVFEHMTSKRMKQR